MVIIIEHKKYKLMDLLRNGCVDKSEGIGINLLEKPGRGFFTQSKGRGAPDEVIHVKPHKPAEEQVKGELSRQQPLVLDCVEHLRPQRLQQHHGASEGRAVYEYGSVNRGDDALSTASPIFARQRENGVRAWLEQGQ